MVDRYGPLLPDNPIQFGLADINGFPIVGGGGSLMRMHL